MATAADLSRHRWYEFRRAGVYGLDAQHDMTQRNVQASMAILLDRLHTRRNVSLDSFLMDDGACRRQS